MQHAWDVFLAYFWGGAQFTFLLDDIGIPKDYRHMDGFGVHTFKLINKAGKETLVKFHWKTQQGALFYTISSFSVPLPFTHTHTYTVQNTCCKTLVMEEFCRRGLNLHDDCKLQLISIASTAGEENLLDDEAVLVGGKNHSHATQDLQDSIAAGDYPEWQLCIQVRVLHP